MVFYEVFSHPELRRYKTSVFSKATIVQLICVVITLLCPFLIAYFSGGFWIKNKIALEQPAVNFQYRYLVLLETANSFYFTSSYDNVNQIYMDAFLPAMRTVIETDSNNDGKNELLQLNLFISGLPTIESVQTVKILLLFNNTLSNVAGIQFESIAYLESSNFKISSDLSFSGELDLFQTQKFIANNIYTDYQFQLLNQNNMDLENLQLQNILETYFQRPYGTRLKTDYVYWSNTNTDGFNINAKIRYPPFSVNYVPAFWEQFKNGWIHYIVVLIPFMFVFNLVKIFIFENQLVSTIAVFSTSKAKMN